MYLPRFSDSILHTLQSAIAWQMLFFMPFQKNVPLILLYDLWSPWWPQNSCVRAIIQGLRTFGSSMDCFAFNVYCVPEYVIFVCPDTCFPVSLQVCDGWIVVLQFSEFGWVKWLWVCHPHFWWVALCLTPWRCPILLLGVPEVLVHPFLVPLSEHKFVQCWSP